jgi:hypothetical protein
MASETSAGAPYLRKAIGQATLVRRCLTGEMPPRLERADTAESPLCRRTPRGERKCRQALKIEPMEIAQNLWLETYDKTA